MRSAEWLAIGAIVASCSGSVGIDAARPKLHALTYADVPDPRVAMSLGTAELHGFYPVILGYGLRASWAYGLSGMANKLRDYIFHHTDPEDIVLFFDAWDVIFQAGEDEIISRYLEIEAREHKTLIYHAEPRCSSPRRSEYPTIHSDWRFLNCGLYIGRSRTLRLLFKDPLPDPLVDKHGRPLRLQNWHTDYYLDHQDTVTLDSQCELMQVVLNIDNLHINTEHAAIAKSPGGHGLVVREGRLRNTITNTTPLVLHFPGSGHWPDFWHPDRVGTCPAYEFFRSAGHPDLAALLEKQSRLIHNFRMRPWKELCAVTTSVDQLSVQLSHFGDTIAWLGHGGLTVAIVTIGIVGVGLCTLYVACRRSRRRITSLRVGLHALVSGLWSGAKTDDTV